MAFKEELIIRTAVGTVLGLALNSFLSSFGRDILKPIFTRKSFNKLENEFVINILGVKINYGDLLGHLFTLLIVIFAVYIGLYVAEKRKVL